jgi:hypothetical protein
MQVFSGCQNDIKQSTSSRCGKHALGSLAKANHRARSGGQLQLGKRRTSLITCPWAHFSTGCPRQELQVGQGSQVAGVSYDHRTRSSWPSHWTSLCLLCHGQLQVTVTNKVLRIAGCQFQRSSGTHKGRCHALQVRWGHSCRGFVGRLYVMNLFCIVFTQYEHTLYYCWVSYLHCMDHPN